MLLFNFKLFFKIAVAIITGASVSTIDSTSVEPVVKTESVEPRIETVQLKENQEGEFKFDQLNDISLDSVSFYLDTPKTIREYKGVIVER